MSGYIDMHYTPTVTTTLCPNCGSCPTCGHGGWKTGPYWEIPYMPTYRMGGFNGTVTTTEGINSITFTNANLSSL